MRNTIARAFVHTTSFCFVFLFIYTASSKLFEPSLFRNTLAKSPLLGHYASALTIALPLIEILIAAFLLFNGTLRIGLYLATVLMLLFTIYIFYMLLFVPELPCSCGGVIRSMSWWQHLAFNCLFIMLGTSSLMITKKPRYNLSLSA